MLAWQHTASGKRESGGMNYSVKSSGAELHFAWGPPATPSMMNAWLDATAGKYDFVEAFKLAKTRENRPVRGMRIAAGDAPLGEGLAGAGEDLHRLHQVREIVAVVGPTRRKRDAAVAEHDRGHAVIARR